jgi:hypothetical protein
LGWYAGHKSLLRSRSCMATCDMAMMQKGIQKNGSRSRYQTSPSCKQCPPLQQRRCLSWCRCWVTATGPSYWKSWCLWANRNRNASWLNDCSNKI